jgi:signal transduction histidine kinase
MGNRNQKKRIDVRRLKREEALSGRSKTFSHASASALAVVFVLALAQFDLDGLKGLLSDGLMRTQWRHSPHPQLRLVGYDDASASRYEEGRKVPVEELAQMLETLAAESPKAVALIGPFNERRYTPSELALLGKALLKVPNPFIGYTDDDSLGKNPPVELSGVRYLPGFISRDTFSYGADSVSRRVMITLQSVPTVYAELANLARPRASFRHAEPLGDMSDSSQTYINWQGGPGTYPITSSLAVAERSFPVGHFKDKIVLVGRVLRSKQAEDFILTPLSRGPSTPLLEGAAHSLATLLDDRGIAKSSSWLNMVLALFIGVVTVNLALFLSPWRGILFVLGETIVLCLAAWTLLLAGDYWLDLAHPLLVACVGYYLVIPYRLVEEYRKRWHYQEKSELMSQLEQLKSNFLSLVTHDLKTPIARIQGNAELILNETSGLTEKQRGSVTAIVHTTEELSKYVETVLDLTRIESAEVPLQKATKDINQAVLEVVEAKRPLAAEKNITLDTDLDPIFSFKFDARLIRRVIANLVENAIKYSPEGGHIRLISREENNWVHVSVADQGIGIPETEQEKVFAKFYRGQHPLTAAVKGTGLGLYLARYFVELHEGIIKLKSDVGKGSTFTVSLPV